MSNVEVAEPILNLPREVALPWVIVVNTDGKHGHWSYAVAKRPTDVVGLLTIAANKRTPESHE